MPGAPATAPAQYGLQRPSLHKAAELEAENKKRHSPVSAAAAERQSLRVSNEKSQHVGQSKDLKLRLRSSMLEEQLLLQLQRQQQQRREKKLQKQQRLAMQKDQETQQLHALQQRFAAAALSPQNICSPDAVATTTAAVTAAAAAAGLLARIRLLGIGRTQEAAGHVAKTKIMTQRTPIIYSCHPPELIVAVLVTASAAGVSCCCNTGRPEKLSGASDATLLRLPITVRQTQAASAAAKTEAAEAPETPLASTLDPSTLDRSSSASDVAPAPLVASPAAMSVGAAPDLDSLTTGYLSCRMTALQVSAGPDALAVLRDSSHEGDFPEAASVAAATEGAPAGALLRIPERGWLQQKSRRDSGCQRPEAHEQMTSRYCSKLRRSAGDPALTGSAACTIPPGAAVARSVHQAADAPLLLNYPSSSSFRTHCSNVDQELRVVHGVHHPRSIPLVSLMRKKYTKWQTPRKVRQERVQELKQQELPLLLGRRHQQQSSGRTSAEGLLEKNMDARLGSHWGLRITPDNPVDLVGEVISEPHNTFDLREIPTLLKVPDLQHTLWHTGSAIRRPRSRERRAFGRYRSRRDSSSSSATPLESMSVIPLNRITAEQQQHQPEKGVLSASIPIRVHRPVESIKSTDEFDRRRRNGGLRGSVGLVQWRGANLVSFQGMGRGMVLRQSHGSCALGNRGHSGGGHGRLMQGVKGLDVSTARERQALLQSDMQCNIAFLAFSSRISIHLRANIGSSPPNFCRCTQAISCTEANMLACIRFYP
ncbi:uncharacterized protein LOC113146683 [Cyclospora cayetanensis]|uniref:Uncharacterized protein LOC113146683 n=1 Tax=Cyclospora cayetanensis TaxID=88456 RepID=A0A6P6RSN8_9EIME|nr:uncharacterized protein LOC113146683 [Cyclospora cayetanensis]